LRRRLAVPAASIVVELEQTDLRFFRPDPDAPGNARPLVYAAGREGRDYATLGEATRDVDVEVLVCAVSATTADPTTMTVPDPMPSNMRFEPLDWVPFRNAYQRADVVVVPLLDRAGSPGLTVIMEAMACKRPVVATRTVGYVEELIDGGYVIGVPPGNADALRTAITSVLANPSAATAMAERAHALMERSHSPEHFVETIVTTMRELAST
jgi:glycosyltransferase involved in cell wall biosynthesis